MGRINFTAIRLSLLVVVILIYIVIVVRLLLLLVVRLLLTAVVVRLKLCGERKKDDEVAVAAVGQMELPAARRCRSIVGSY